jgi:glycosyltransferase involved in cell wall biosynthesis
LVLFTPLTRLAKLRNILASGKIFPLKIWTRYSRPLLDYVQAHAHEYDIVHLEFTHAAAVLPVLAGKKRPGQQWVVTCHDVLIQGKLRQGRRLGSLLGNTELAAIFSFENELFKLVDQIIVLSSKDAKLIESLYLVPTAKIRVVEPYLSPFTEEVRARRSAVTVSPKAILFWGAMNRQENEEAALVFFEKFGARLAAGGYTLYVVGNAPSERVKKLASEHVVVTGFVEDPTPYFVKCAVGVVPLLSGAGIKIKTLEMLKSGIPVVATSIGAEGIEHENLHVVELDAFFQVIERLIG